MKKSGCHFFLVFLFFIFFLSVSCANQVGSCSPAPSVVSDPDRKATTPPPKPKEELSDFVARLVAAAKGRLKFSVRYDGSYVTIPYPNGDVPADQGVCTDEIVRIYRAVGYDLQQLVHEDFRRNLSAYPAKWKGPRPDPNIDHRRVPNLMVFFSRQGDRLPITANGADYAPGDLVAWDLGDGLTHIGILVDEQSSSGNPLVVHNIGEGPRMQAVLFSWKIIGHYRYPRSSAGAGEAPSTEEMVKKIEGEI
jgi:uncharacterized protein YijF (DUF1287 family)